MEKKKTVKKKTTNVKTATKTTKRKTAKKKQKKTAFTLIELLAVIIILGILMIVAIPAVTSYISNSRKSTYVNTAKAVMDGARTKVNEGKLGMYDTDTTYYLPYDSIKTETGDSKSPYGDFEKAYVAVTYNGNNFSYYWTSVDTSGAGIKLTNYDDLDNDDIETDLKVEDISTSIGVCGKSKIVVFKTDGTIDDYASGDASLTSCYDSKTNSISENQLIETIEQDTFGTISVGDEIVIGGKEHFYVVSSDSSRTTLIAKYNLYVGNIVDTSSTISMTAISESDSRYGWQNSEAIGYKNIMNWTRNVGVVGFSSNRYWLDSNNKVMSKYGGDTSWSIMEDVNVYDSSISSVRPTVSCNNGNCKVTNSGYSIAYYVNQYVSKLRSLGLTVHEGRLLKVEEAGNLGCWLGASSSSCSGYRYQFLRNTNFWIGGLYNTNSVRYIYFNNIGFENDPASAKEHGVRPVIVINTSEIPLLDQEYFDNKPTVVY